MPKGTVCTDSLRFFFPFAVPAFSSLVEGQSASSMPALVVVPFLLGPMGPTAVGLLPEWDRGDSDASLLLFLPPPLLRPPPPSDHIAFAVCRIVGN